MTEEPLSSTHPPLPPTTEDDRRLWLRLLRSRRVGPSTFYRLMAQHGTVQNALAALPELAREAGVKGYRICPEEVIDAELKAAIAAKARLLCIGEPEYPAALAELTNAPPVIWARGNADILQRPLIAMVGARNASSLGQRMARALAADLGARGAVIVSGLARGIDATAHRAALDTGTCAVVAGGTDVFYPIENRALQDKIAEEGVVLSEQPMGLSPQARHFPARNRIISGMSRGVIVIEAAARSGSLITARDGLDQGREVMAVPGHPFDARAAGCNMLLRDGAVLVRNADDVIEALGLIQQTESPAAQTGLPMDLPTEAPGQHTQHSARPRSLRDTAALHQQILDRLGPSPLAEDQLIRDLARPAAEVAPVLVDLELDGQIERAAGGLLSRGR